MSSKKSPSSRTCRNGCRGRSPSGPEPPFYPQIASLAYWTHSELSWARSIICLFENFIRTAGESIEKGKWYAWRFSWSGGGGRPWRKFYGFLAFWIFSFATYFFFQIRFVWFSSSKLKVFASALSCLYYIHATASDLKKTKLDLQHWCH